MSESPKPGTSQDSDGDRVEEEARPCSTDKGGLFKVDTGRIPQALLDDQVSELQQLGLSVFNQDEFEQGVIKQVDKAMAKDEALRQKRILKKELESISDDLRLVENDLDHIRQAEQSVQQQYTTPRDILHRLQAIKKQKENKMNQLKTLKVRQKVAEDKLQKAEEAEKQETSDENEGASSNATEKLLEGLSGQPKNETKRDRMIRLGLMTPFGTVVKAAHKDQASTDFGHFLMNRESKGGKKKPVKKSSLTPGSNKRPLPEATSSQAKKRKSNLFDEKDFKNYDRETDYTEKRFQRKRTYKMAHNFSEDVALSGDEHQEEDGECLESDKEYIPDGHDTCYPFGPDTETEDSEGQPKAKKMKGEFYTGELETKKAKRKLTKRKTNVPYRRSDDEEEYQPGLHKLKRNRSITLEKDDAEESYYMTRLRLQQKKDEHESDDSGEDEQFEGGLVVPGKIWNKLFKYQKTGVRWLWELHCQQSGGIIGDEMGLGKTIQMIAFFAALKTSKIPRHTGLGPCIIVCPATVMHQWVKEFHTWWPDFRVAILHSSGSFTGSQEQLVRNMVKANGILVTSFSTLVIQQDLLLPYNWHYIVLDEGHKIRNPDAQVTLCCKQFRTSHRIILSGSPIQNNLKELWSLVDFVYPGKLGTLPDFMEHFSVPIVQGGYCNASQIQVETAYKCACVLRNTINPYLLRRMKADVKSTLDLPAKNEQVLFCRLTDEQRDVYKEYLESRECQAILSRKMLVFPGLQTLRKICNHPDICTGGPRVLVGEDVSGSPELEYGYWRRSGKMVVVEALLRLWHQQGHRVLLFTQGTKMLDILESFVKERKYIYLRMDGSTNIRSRQPMVTQFNQTKDIYLFLLTTKVGGLGVNLTGANRIIIFDPDWNPSTDTQARERAWRVGQKRQVTVYRLLTSGTIEEKIYHKQIFKQFLTNRVLEDPRQRRFFKAHDFHELFSLGSKDDEGTETSAIFAGTGSDVHMPRRTAVAPKPTPKALMPNRFDEMKKEKEKAEEQKIKEQKAEEGSSSEGMELSDREKMRELARKLSRQMEEAKRQREIKTGESGQKNPDSSRAGKGKHSKGSGSSSENERKCGEGSSRSRTPAKHREHHRKKKKDAKFEGQRIPNLVKSCDYKQQDGTPEEEEPVSSKEQDDYVLRALFKKTGVHGVMKHDKIMDSSRADYAIVEAEAAKVAKEAAAALKRSRARCMSAASGVPTWTGTHGGLSAKPKFGQRKNCVLGPKPVETITKATDKNGWTSNKKPKKESVFDGSQAGALSLTADKEMFVSKDLLVGMNKQQHLSTPSTSTAGASDGQGADVSTSTLDPKDLELIEDIRCFISFMGDVNGQAFTQELLTNFGQRLPKGDSAKFKAMLLQICDFQKVNGSGLWTLKAEFR